MAKEIGCYHPPASWTLDKTCWPTVHRETLESQRSQEKVWDEEKRGPCEIFDRDPKHGKVRVQIYEREAGPANERAPSENVLKHEYPYMQAKTKLDCLLENQLFFAQSSQTQYFSYPALMIA